MIKKSSRVRGVGGGGGGGYVKNVNRTINADISRLSFFSFFLSFFLRFRLRYILLIKFTCLLVDLCELLVNLRCVVTKINNLNK